MDFYSLGLVKKFHFCCMLLDVNILFSNKTYLLSQLQELAVMESMHLALENVVSAVFDESHEFGGSFSETQLALCRIFEGFPWTSFHIIRVFKVASYSLLKL